MNQKAVMINKIPLLLWCKWWCIPLPGLPIVEYLGFFSSWYWSNCWIGDMAIFRFGGESLLRLEATEPLPVTLTLWPTMPILAWWWLWFTIGVQISCPPVVLYALMDDVITGKSAIWFVIDDVSEPSRSLLGLGSVIWGRRLRVP